MTIPVLVGVLMFLLIALPILIWLMWRWDAETKQLEEAVLECLDKRPWQTALSLVIQLHHRTDLIEPALIPNSTAMRYVLDGLYRDGRVAKTAHKDPVYALRGAK